MSTSARANQAGRNGPIRVMRILFLALVLLCPGDVGQAALDNSHHDMRHYHPDANPCLACHGKDAASYRGLLPRETGEVGTMCVFVCHSGKGMLPETATLVPAAGPNVDVRDYSTSQSPDFTTVYFTRSHGNDPAKLVDGVGRPVPWPPAGVSWAGSEPGRKMECTTCHSVHENAHSPFLRGALAANYPKRDGFCDRCHHQWATNNLTGSPDGMHPVDFPVDNAAAALRGGSGRHPRRIRIQKYGRRDAEGTVSVFDVPNPAPAALNDTDVHWEMGGHLTDGPGLGMRAWTGAGSRQQMGCYTCHPVHQGSRNVSESLLALPLVDDEYGWNPLCVGCHGSATSLEGDRKEWDVGVTGFGHPAGSQTAKKELGLYRTTVGNFLFRIATVIHFNPGRGNRFGPQGQLLCTTCHKIHYGQPYSMGIADLGQGNRSVCRTCHNGVGMQNENDWSKGGTVLTGHNLPNSHHVTAFRVTVDGKHAPAQETGNSLFIQNPSWADPASGLGDLATGMDCADCHVFNKTAHNW